MKLAEALQERADLNRNIEQLKSRLSMNAISQENEAPAEDPDELLKELDSSVKRLCELICKINITNCHVMKDGKSITELIAERDTILISINAYRQLVNSASQTGMRARAREIKLISTVDVKSMQKKIDAMSKELRQIDNTIQELNWTSELI